VIDVINRDGNLSKGVDYDALFYGVHVSGWMLMVYMSPSKCKNNAATFLPRRCVKRKT